METGLQVHRDEVPETLADARRRRLLLAVLRHDRGGDGPVSIVPSDVDDPVEHVVSMKHTHLPRLAAEGFVDWDRTHHEVTAGPNFEAIQPALEAIEREGSDHDGDRPAE